MYYKNSDPIDVISMDDVKYWVQDYTTVTDEDDDEMLRLKTFIKSLPSEDQVLLVLRLEGFTLMTISAFLGISHTWVRHKYNKIIEQCRSLHS